MRVEAYTCLMCRFASELTAESSLNFYRAYQNKVQGRTSAEDEECDPMVLNDSLEIALSLGREENADADRRQRVEDVRATFLRDIQEGNTSTSNRGPKPITDKAVGTSVANEVIESLLPGLIDDGGASLTEEEFGKNIATSYRNLVGVNDESANKEDSTNAKRSGEHEKINGSMDENTQPTVKTRNPRHVRLGASSSIKSEAKRAKREKQRGQKIEDGHREWRRRQREEAIKREKAALAVANEKIYLRRVKIENDAARRARDMRKTKMKEKKGIESSYSLNRKRMNQRLQKENRKIAERLRKVGPKRKTFARHKREERSAKSKSPSLHPTAPSDGAGLNGGGTARSLDGHRQRYLSVQPLLDEIRDLRRAITAIEKQNKIDAARLRRAEGRAKRAVSSPKVILYMNGDI